LAVQPFFKSILFIKVMPAAAQRARKVHQIKVGIIRPLYPSKTCRQIQAAESQRSTLRKVDTPFVGRAVVQAIPQSLGADATAHAGHDLATVLCCIDLPKAIAD
jgi:hypothetical protein